MELFIRELNVPCNYNGEYYLFDEKNVALIAIPKEKEFEKDIQSKIKSIEPDIDVIYLYEDRWWHDNEVVKKRIQARLGNFESVFARKCKIISQNEWHENNDLMQPNQFLDLYHSYGNAKCKYKYALVYRDKIVAVATFSQSRPMPRKISAPYANVASVEKKNLVILNREDVAKDCEGATMDMKSFAAENFAVKNFAVEVDSYEWVRYASIPNIRVIGGMGRLLKAFIKDREKEPFKPGYKQRFIEVMSYSDNEWSSGATYRELGFVLVSERQSVEYYVDKVTYERFSERALLMEHKKMPPIPLSQFYKIKNRGSLKYIYAANLPYDNLVFLPIHL